MALDFKITKSSPEGSPQVTLMQDDTTNYGVDGNPTRETLALYVEFAKRLPDGSHDAESAGVVYLLDGAPTTEETANQVQVTFPDASLYRVTASLLPILSAIDPLDGYVAVGRMVFDSGTGYPGEVIDAVEAGTDVEGNTLYAYLTLPVLSLIEQDVIAQESFYAANLYPLDLSYKSRVMDLYDPACCTDTKQATEAALRYGLLLDGIRANMRFSYWDKVQQLINELQHLDRFYESPRW